MTQTAIRRRKVDMPSGIKKKFTAALSMLLVAAILMVGSTYAWFTLSTAPEVKGITTSIGANGNLEIALLNATSYASTAADLGIISNVGDSMENTTNWTVDQANHTWGNLVDLGVATYGLANIILLPAALNITNPTAATGTAHTIGTSILKAPGYGGDGRVTVVNTDTVTGKAQGAVFTQDNAFAGVRAIGVASERSLRQQAYVNATEALADAISSAVATSRTTLNDYGQALSAIIVRAAMASDRNTLTFSGAELSTLSNVINGLNDANAFVLEAVKQAALADQLGEGGATLADDAAVTALVDQYNAYTETDIAGLSLSTDVAAAFAKYQSNKTAIATAQGHVTTASTGSEPYPYSVISPILNDIANDNGIGLRASGSSTIVSIYDTETHQRKERGTLETELGGISAIGSGMTVIFGEGSGLIYDLAKAVGNFSSNSFNISASDVGFTGLSSNIPVSLMTNASSPILPAAQSSINGAPTGTGGTAAYSINPYGYALDFGVRTNADGANLLLQTSEKQRIYNDPNNPSTNEDTFGEGSYLEFTATATFDATKVARLMDAIRIVFAEPTADGFNVLAIAKTGTPVTTGNNVKAALALYEYTLEAKAGEAPVLTIGEAKKDTNDNPDYTIAALTKNQAKKITVIVYLDGDIADNTFVANAPTSMAGKLNLQFTTDKALVPMENAALRGTLSESDQAKARFKSLVTDQFSQDQLTQIATDVTNGATGWKSAITTASRFILIAGENDLDADQLVTVNAALDIIEDKANEIEAWKETWNAEHPNP